MSSPDDRSARRALRTIRSTWVSLGLDVRRFDRRLTRRSMHCLKDKMESTRQEPVSGVEWAKARVARLVPRGQNRARAVPTRPISRNRFRPPSYGATRQALTARVWVVPGGAAAARGAMRSAARGRRGRCAQGLASGNCCNSQHHLISGRTTRSVAHIPHACGEEATRMRPIYDDGYCLAQGWHGHYPSRADRVAMRRGAPVVSVSRYTC